MKIFEGEENGNFIYNFLQEGYLYREVHSSPDVNRQWIWYVMKKDSDVYMKEINGKDTTSIRPKTKYNLENATITELGPKKDFPEYFL